MSWKSKAKNLKNKFLHAYKSTRNEPTISHAELKKKYNLQSKLSKSKNMKEDLEMISSKNYQECIKKAREKIREGQTYSLDQVKKELNT